MRTKTNQTVLLTRTLVLFSYISTICQLHRVNIERRSLFINTAIPLVYKYPSSKVMKYQEASGSQSADLTSRHTAEFRPSSPLDFKKIPEPQTLKLLL